MISCDPLDISGLTNPPQLIPDAGEAIPFGESVTMMCTVEGADPTEFNRTRTCLYDVTEKKYALIGDPLECGGKSSSCSSVNHHKYQAKHYIHHLPSLM